MWRYVDERQPGEHRARSEGTGKGGDMGVGIKLPQGAEEGGGHDGVADPVGHHNNDAVGRESGRLETH